MHKSYFLFEKQCRFLDNRLTGRTINDVFTYRKNELVFDLSNDFLRLNISRNYPALLLTPAQNVKTPRYRVFKNVYSDTILGINITPFDKHVTIRLANGRIETFFFGRHPNILFYNSQDRLSESFKVAPEPVFTNREQKADFRIVDPETLSQLILENPQSDFNGFLSSHFAAMGPVLRKEIIHRSGIPGDRKMEKTDNRETENLLSVFRELKDKLEDETGFLYFRDDLPFKVAAFPLKHIAGDYREKPVDTLNAAWTRFTEEITRTEVFDALYGACKKALNNRERYLKRTLNKIRDAENVEQKKEQAELKGNLLLTFKNNIEPHTDKVSLQNIFSNTQEKIDIALDPRKSVSENARAYFEKYKNVNELNNVFKAKKNAYAHELEVVTTLQEDLENSRKITELEKLRDRLVDMKMIQAGDRDMKSETALEYSFNRVFLDERWHVYLGKNGENNDLLTFRFAHKWDYWFHAQGVPGSHVVLRLPSKETEPPPAVLEQAAQLAAANSRSKHSETVPVVYTRVKYVHRIRKASPGTVRLTNETVIFVKPLRIS